jgi:hypothetical protein
MLVKIVTVVFYVMLALFFFHIGFPYEEFLIGVGALVLGILALQ